MKSDQNISTSIYSFWIRYHMYSLDYFVLHMAEKEEETYFGINFY